MGHELQTRREFLYAGVGALLLPSGVRALSGHASDVGRDGDSATFLYHLWRSERAGSAAIDCRGVSRLYAHLAGSGPPPAWNERAVVIVPDDDRWMAELGLLVGIRAYFSLTYRHDAEVQCYSAVGATYAGASSRLPADCPEETIRRVGNSRVACLQFDLNGAIWRTPWSCRVIGRPAVAHIRDAV